MFQMKTLFVIGGLFTIFFFSCKEDHVLPDCKDHDPASIHEQTMERWPYPPDLEALIFADTTGREYRFEVSEFLNLYSCSRFQSYNLAREYYIHRFYSKDSLGIAISIILSGDMEKSYSSTDANIYFDQVSIVGPDVWEAPVGYKDQSGIFNRMTYGCETVIPESPDFDSLQIGSETFSEVYASTGNFNFYFNFEKGLVGMELIDSGLELALVRVE